LSCNQVFNRHESTSKQPFAFFSCGHNKTSGVHGLKLSDNYYMLSLEEQNKPKKRVKRNLTNSNEELAQQKNVFFEMAEGEGTRGPFSAGAPQGYL
jgi:hypothetical protein